MKKINVTFSLPEETNKRLHGLVGRRKMSSFVTDALNKALDEKMNLFRIEYAQSEQDPDRQEVISDWKILDTEDWVD